MLPAADHIPQLLVLLSQLSDELVLTKRCLGCYLYRAFGWSVGGNACSTQQGTENIESSF